MTSSVHAGIPRLIGLEWLQKHEDAVVLRWRRACELFQLFPRSHSLPNVPVKPVYKWLFFFFPPRGLGDYTEFQSPVQR